MKHIMTYHPLIIICLVLFCVHQGSTQSDLNDVLVSIKNNNKQIQAYSQYSEAEKLQYKVGLTLPNPTVGYDFMVGTPATAGNQNDLTITQAFEFPTVYGRKKELSELQIAQLPYQAASVRQNILLETQMTCNEIIYLKKMLSELTKRKESVEKLNRDFNKSLENGDGNIIDVNKTKLQLVDVNASYRQYQSQLQQAQLRLTSLNGGIEITFMDSVYTEQMVNATLETLVKESLIQDPNLKYLESAKMIAQQEIKVAKALTLPKMEVGYHYQGILGQRFQGGHFGFSIPLWENRHLVQAKDSKRLHADKQLDAFIHQKQLDVRQVYDKFKNTKVILDEYKTVFSSLNNVSLLNKALEMGHISTIEYFMETSYFYNTVDKYLLMEKSYYDLSFEIHKYKL